jgi:hypothetical protein
MRSTNINIEIERALCVSFLKKNSIMIVISKTVSATSILRVGKAHILNPHRLAGIKSVVWYNNNQYSGVGRICEFLTTANRIAGSQRGWKSDRFSYHNKELA